MEFNPAIARNPDAVAFRLKWCDDPNIDGALRLPPVTLSSEDSARRAEIMTNVNTYCNEMILKFIVGTEPLDNFDAYLKQLDTFGMEEAVQMTQTAYDQYMSR